ncbi:uncharacterized protein LOC111293412 [Durio zibethinus]|uniref:Uncharacterized protein LOC111293412 n=1 Tax=Durio zibethinus TaxID=66656 RepID=A0A6P5YP45_DURZI|nr:uncharacterized protein LOC111293412 [Durio zibethinus]
MEEKKDFYYCQRGNGNDQNVNTALFTAGIVLLMVCLKRASLLFLAEQWRAWVFLVLNIVLLAIFFTSMNPNSSQISHQESKKNDEEMKQKRGNCNDVEACNKELMLNSKKRSKTEADEEKPENDQLLVEEENIEPPKLSKEELNERVEAFIAMFRQHLALDARKGRDHKFHAERKPADMKKHMTLSSDGVNCLVLKVQG